MAKKKAGKEEKPSEGASPVEAGPSKMGMVREALGSLGNEAKPKQIDEYVRAKYGVEIPPTMISSYKSTITGVGASRSRAGTVAGNGAVAMSDIETVKRLVERIGADQLQSLVRVLS